MLSTLRAPLCATTIMNHAHDSLSNTHARSAILTLLTASTGANFPTAAALSSLPANAEALSSAATDALQLDPDVHPDAEALSTAAAAAAAAASQAAAVPAAPESRKLEQRWTDDYLSPDVLLEFSVAAHYQLSLVPLTDPSALRVRAMSYCITIAGSAQPCSIELVLCGLPQMLVAALGFSSAGDVPAMVHDALGDAIRGVAGAAEALASTVASNGRSVDSVADGAMLLIGLSPPAAGDTHATAAPPPADAPPLPLYVLANTMYHNECSSAAPVLVSLELVQQLQAIAGQSAELAPELPLHVEPGDASVVTVDVGYFQIDSSRHANASTSNSSNATGLEGSGYAELPVIVSAADGVSSLTYSVLLFSDPDALPLHNATAHDGVVLINSGGAAVVSDALNAKLALEVSVCVYV